MVDDPVHCRRGLVRPREPSRSGRRSPSRHSVAMVLPAPLGPPLGPVMQNTLPTSKLTLSTATTLRYTFRRDATCAVRASEGYILVWFHSLLYKGLCSIVSCGPRQSQAHGPMLTPRYT